MDRSTIERLIHEGAPSCNGDGDKLQRICAKLRVNTTGKNYIAGLLGVTITPSLIVGDSKALFKFVPYRTTKGITVLLFNRVILNNKGYLCSLDKCIPLYAGSKSLEGFIKRIKQPLIDAISEICDPIIEEGEYE